MLGQNGETCFTRPTISCVCRADDDGFRREARADVAVAAIGREDRHARPVRNRDARLLGIGRAVEHRDVILAADRDPDLAAVLGEKRLVRRASDIGRVLDPVGGGIDEGHRIRGDRDDRERLAVGREAEPMDEDLALVERRQVHRLRIAEADDAEVLVGRRIDHRDGVGELLGGIDAVPAADGKVRRVGRKRRLSGMRRNACEQERGREKQHGGLFMS